MSNEPMNFAPNKQSVSGALYAGLGYVLVICSSDVRCLVKRTHRVAGRATPALTGVASVASRPDAVDKAGPLRGKPSSNLRGQRESIICRKEPELHTARFPRK